jgi:uncharacterized Zn finger protein (UPF0148 family)
MPAKASERRTIYLQRKELKLCPRCGKKVKKSGKFIYCDDCREFFRTYNNENSESIQKTRKSKYDLRIKNGQCPRCGKKLGKKYGKKICSSCLDKQYKYNTGKKRPAELSAKSKKKPKKQ